VRLSGTQRRWLEGFSRGHGYGGRGGSVVLRSLEAMGLAYPTHGWDAAPLTVTVTAAGMRELLLLVSCPECGNEQAEMGCGVACEECGFGPMPRGCK
jgi:hypothetical protein